LRDLPSGSKVGNFGLAVNRRYHTQDGDEREETTFVDIAAFGRSAENIGRYCRKGSPLLVEGRLRFESWQNDQGEKRNRLSVVLESFQFLPDGKGGDSSGNDSTNAEVDAPY
jgi:single-strand DNA-binding protein